MKGNNREHRDGVSNHYRIPGQGACYATLPAAILLQRRRGAVPWDCYAATHKEPPDILGHLPQHTALPRTLAHPTTPPHIPTPFPSDYPHLLLDPTRATAPHTGRDDWTYAHQHHHLYSSSRTLLPRNTSGPDAARLAPLPLGVATLRLPARTGAEQDLSRIPAAGSRTDDTAITPATLAGTAFPTGTALRRKIFARRGEGRAPGLPPLSMQLYFCRRFLYLQPLHAFTTLPWPRVCLRCWHARYSADGDGILSYARVLCGALLAYRQPPADCTFLPPRDLPAAMAASPRYLPPAPSPAP